MLYNTNPPIPNSFNYTSLQNESEEDIIRRRDTGDGGGVEGCSDTGGGGGAEGGSDTGKRGGK